MSKAILQSEDAEPRRTLTEDSRPAVSAGTHPSSVSATPGMLTTEDMPRINITRAHSPLVLMSGTPHRSERIIRKYPVRAHSRPESGIPRERLNPRRWKDRPLGPRSSLMSARHRGRKELGHSLSTAQARSIIEGGTPRGRMNVGIQERTAGACPNCEGTPTRRRLNVGSQGLPAGGYPKQFSQTTTPILRRPACDYRSMIVISYSQYRQSRSCVKAKELLRTFGSSPSPLRPVHHRPACAGLNQTTRLLRRDHSRFTPLAMSPGGASRMTEDGHDHTVVR